MPKQTLGEQAYRTIKQMILGGRLAPRERLNEGPLAAELGVSRTPLREAIRMLEQEGLVVRDTLGAYVKGLSYEEARDLYAVRVNLEGLAAHLAAQQMHDAEQRLRLETVVAQMERVVRDGDISSLETINGEFHRTICRIAGNGYLKDVLEDIRSRLSVLRAGALQARERTDESLTEHKELARIIATGDAVAAAAFGREHARRAAEFALGRLFFVRPREDAADSD